MSDLLGELLLRLARVAIAIVVGLIVYLVVLLAGASPSAELALLCWLSGAAAVLLLERSII